MSNGIIKRIIKALIILWALMVLPMSCTMHPIGFAWLAVPMCIGLIYWIITGKNLLDKLD